FVFHIVFFFSSRRRHTRFSRDWSSDVCSSDLILSPIAIAVPLAGLIVVAEKELGLAVGGVAVHFIQQLAELRGGELVHVGNLKIHGQLDFVVFRTVHFRELCNVRLVRLADQNGISRI